VDKRTLFLWRSARRLNAQSGNEPENGHLSRLEEQQLADVFPPGRQVLPDCPAQAAPAEISATRPLIESGRQSEAKNPEEDIENDLAHLYHLSLMPEFHDSHPTSRALDPVEDILDFWRRLLGPRNLDDSGLQAPDHASRFLSEIHGLRFKVERK